MKKLLVLLGFFFLILPLIYGVRAQASQEQKYEGRVVKIIEDKILITDNTSRPYQKVEVEISSGQLKGRKVITEMGGIVVSNEDQKVKMGDSVVLSRLEKIDGTEQFYILDFIRRKPLYFLVGFFMAAVLLIGGIRGASSFLGLAISFVVLLKYIIPQIVSGKDPILIAISGSFLIIIATLYLAHGISRKTTAAVLGTSISLLITAFLALFFVKLSRLSGFGSEDASFLSLFPGATLNLQGILLAGIIIGALGVLDDITISQAACVFELKRANKDFSWQELYRRSLRVGRDHIASLVNTLVLAYAGASLPLLLLFSLSGGEPFVFLINREVIANEIVRTLVGSLGLVSAVPITTLIAVSLARSK